MNKCVRELPCDESSSSPSVRTTAAVTPAITASDVTVNATAKTIRFIFGDAAGFISVNPLFACLSSMSLKVFSLIAENTLLPSLVYAYFVLALTEDILRFDIHDSTIRISMKTRTEYQLIINNVAHSPKYIG